MEMNWMGLRIVLNLSFSALLFLFASTHRLDSVKEKQRARATQRNTPDFLLRMK